ncbi:MAG: hypothetical protein AAB316_11515 [Bacteroidota bacterium]
MKKIQDFLLHDSVVKLDPAATKQIKGGADGGGNGYGNSNGNGNSGGGCPPPFPPQ